MTFLARFRIGDGRLSPELRAALDSEGLVVLEEGLHGSIRYRRFKAPGRRHHGKVTLERLGLAISEHRFVVYCRSGTVKLIDTPFADPRMRYLEVSPDGDDAVSIRIDFDRAEIPRVSGQITITAKTPDAAVIVDQLRARLPRSG